MTKITEDYVSYEVAKLLKEKGFAEICVACYDWIDNSFKTIYHDTTGEVEPQDWNNLTFEEAGKIGLANWNRNISAPTHQMAMKWLREKDIDIVIMPLFKFKGGRIYCYEVHSETVDIRTGQFDTYEQAVEAALKYYLKTVQIYERDKNGKTT